MIILILYAILTFLAGFIVEASCVFWVHYHEKNKANQVGLFSLIVCTCQVLGIGESIHNRYMCVLYIIGYSLGGYFATKYKYLLK